MDDDRLDAAAKDLLDKVIERSTDGALRLDEYQEVVEDVALAHAVPFEGLLERFGGGLGKDFRVELNGGGVGGP